MYLSDRAFKAQKRNKSRRIAAYVQSTPRLERTKTLAVIRPPVWSKQRRVLASKMPELLPDFTWNSSKNWWQGPLEQLGTAFELLNNLTQTTIPTSDGVTIWLGEGER